MFHKAKQISSDLATLLQGYADEWVALSEDQTRVVGRGRTLHEALSEAKKNGCSNPTLTKVPKHYGAYVL